MCVCFGWHDCGMTTQLPVQWHKWMREGPCKKNKTFQKHHNIFSSNFFILISEHFSIETASFYRYIKTRMRLKDNVQYLQSNDNGQKLL